ncbi:MAG: YlbF family regulator [Lachnospiraceae bacterium]|nr:YlbF family regulator [Lachnospiraceae bacterium]
MKEIQKAIDTFVKAIKNSDVYREYVHQKESVRQVPGLKEKIDEYRKKNYEFQSYEGDDLFEKVDELEEEMDELKEDPLVRAYLAAELEVCRMVQTINVSIAEAVDIDIDLQQ